ncbi:host specificity protein J [Pasteurella multocida]|uniref:host specificity protein J n=1 Tax=Pasteurella multocida TaxID=747 RepID=UPI00147FB0E4|nr:phage tail protein [Pasteurella multocida]NNI43711.1 phage tail protein [Pasteurella multocida]NNI46320.1 phage tail protein [Pasteurella multocida]NNI74376.1 phage tail protein [Pasteurella multocida]HDR1425128.1 host specificity protein J [Pasteurella multocida]
MQITGGKGGKGGGGGRTPVEARDSLRSLSYAKFIDVISCGEISGPVDGLKSVYFGDIPLQDENGNFNFKNVAIEYRTGTVKQPPSEICETTEVTTDINTEVKKNKPIIRSITAPEADIARVTITVPGLSHQNKSNGDINGTKVELQVEYQANGSQWIDAGKIVIDGKTTSSYNREHSFRLTGESPWSVRVTRLTEDSESQTLQNKTIFSKLTTVFEEKLTYPGVAYVGVQIDAEQFSSIPARGYHCRGIKLKVPSNYDPITRLYTGDWDGTFAVKYSNNPVWIYFDLLTNEEYGAGEYIKEDMLDKWSMYQIAKYCDELVPDGFGGYEPRFTCNAYIQTRQEAIKLLRDLTSVFRAMSYWASGTQILVQDSPKEPMYQFNNTNVVDGQFSRSGSNIKTRHNVALVTWNDPKKFYKQSVEYIEDADAIIKMGYISQTEVVAFGCTSRGQARRLGKWLLYTEQHESEVVTFSCGQDGAIPVPGEVIQVSDVHRAGERRGGRVKTGSTVNQIILDAAVEITKASTISIVNEEGKLEQRNITQRGSLTEININPAFTSVTEDSTWIIASSDIEPELYRVVAVAEGESGTYTISALSYNPSKFSHIENGENLIEYDTTNNTLETGVKNVVISDEIYRGLGGSIQTKIVVSYEPATSLTSRYQVEYRAGNDNWQQLEPTTLTSVDIPNVRDGIAYQIRIKTSNVLGVWSHDDPVTIYEPIGKLRPPHNVTNLRHKVVTQEGVFLVWDLSPDIDLEYYEIKKGDTYESAQLVAKIKANEFNLGFIQAGNHKYWLSAVDSSEVRSETPTEIQFTISSGEVINLNAEIVGDEVLLTWNETQNNSFSTELYEVKKDDEVLALVKSTSFKFKADFSGNKTFKVTAIDLGENRSASAQAQLIIHQPTQVSISQQVIDNYVMLRWQSAKATLPIVYYELKKGDTFDTAEFITNIDGLAFPQFETVGGLYKYWIVGVDSAGNRGEPQFTHANVAQPPDYILKYDHNSEYDGVKNGSDKIDGKLYLPIKNETWKQHFQSNNFTTPQSQINAGFPIYLQPTAISGYYEEEMDYGTVLASSKISLTPKIVSAGNYDISYYIAVKQNEGDSWREHNQASVYETNFRYLKFRITVSNARQPVVIEQLNLKLDQKQKTDGGTVQANASDVNGTWVSFSTEFIDASIPVLTPQSKQPLFATSDFKDEPRPKGFYVFLFDKNGNRVSGKVGWVVKGV